MMLMLLLLLLEVGGKMAVSTNSNVELSALHVECQHRVLHKGL